MACQIFIPKLNVGVSPESGAGILPELWSFDKACGRALDAGENDPAPPWLASRAWPL